MAEIEVTGNDFNSFTWLAGSGHGAATLGAVRRAGHAGADPPAGVLLLAPDNSIAQTDDAADAWLDELGGHSASAPPPVVSAPRLGAGCSCAGRSSATTG